MNWRHRFVLTFTKCWQEKKKKKNSRGQTLSGHCNGELFVLQTFSKYHFKYSATQVQQNIWKKSQEKYSKFTVLSLPCVQWGCSDAFGRHYTPAGRSDSISAQRSTGCTVCDSVYVLKSASNNNLINWLIDAFFLTAVQSCRHVNHVLNFVFLSARSFSSAFDEGTWLCGITAC